MKIDVTWLDMQHQVGKCSICGMTGHLFLKPYIGKEHLDAFTGSTPEFAAARPTCVTCCETPTGCKSPNLTHKKLPKEEYK